MKMTVRDAPRSSGWLYQATDKGREALDISNETDIPTKAI